jgi:cobalt-zinc-cadmium efflux system outer membrane protein
MLICPRMSQMAALATAVVLAMPAPGALGQTAAGVLTLRDAIARAQAHAPSLQSAKASLDVADANLSSAGLLPNPTVSVESENIAGTGRYTGFGASETTYSLSMPLELGGKRAARVRVAEAERTGAVTGVTAAKADLTLRITQAFITLAANQRRAASTHSRQDLAGQARNAARLRVASGKASPIEEQRAEVQWVNASTDAERADRATKLASAQLARLLDSAGLPAIAAPWFDDIARVPRIDGRGTPPALAAADAQIAVATARVDAARRARIPDVTLSIGARRLKETNDSAAVVALSVPLPLFNRGTAEVARSRAELDRTEAERRAAALDFAEAQASAQADVDDARASAAAASGPALAAAREAARIARLGYAEGKFSQLDLIEAERTLSESQEAAINALSAFHLARARLARLYGQTEAIYED